MTATEDLERDRHELHALRERAMAADNAADASAMADLLDEDIVIMPQGVPVVEGREACLEFVRAVLTEFPTRRVEYFNDELIISGDVAIDRGHFTQATAGREGEDPCDEVGTYVWIYKRAADGSWKVSRIIFNVMPAYAEEREPEHGD